MTDKVRVILENLFYSGFVTNYGELLKRKKEKVNQAYKALNKIRVDEEKIEKIIDSFMAKSPDSTVLYFDEVKDLAH